MGQGLQILKPVEGINTDVAPEYLKNTQVRYALNLERGINQNRTGQIGYNNALVTPASGNIKVPYTQPPGNNKVIGRHYAKRTREVYLWVYNDESYHHIYRINADNTTQMVLLDPLLNFSADPKYKIAHAHLFFNHNSFVEQNNKLVRKYLAWVAGDNWQGFLDVEAAIATNGFSTDYFACDDRTQLWQLPTRPSLVCPGVEYGSEIDTTKTNLIADKTWQFRIKFIYTDGRETAWGPISEMLVPTGGLCAVSAEGQPRCINMEIDAGGPQVEKIKLAFRNCVGSLTTDQDAEWFECAVFDKYEKCLDSNTPFWERAIRDDMDYDPERNTFLYTYCGEGTCLPINRKETDRNYIDIPKYSFALVPKENRLALFNNVIGEDKVDCGELNKITFTQDNRNDNVTACQPEYCTVKVGIIIHNQFNKMNQLVYAYDSANSEEALEGIQQYFGGLYRDKDSLHNSNNADPVPFKQLFKDTSSKAGFIVYMEGSEAFTRTKQYRVQAGIYTRAIISNWNSQSDVERDRLKGGDYYYVQVAEVKVIKGTKGFIRIASHTVTPSESYRNTSTTLLGRMREGEVYHPTLEVTQANCDYGIQEIYVDTCGQDEIDLRATPFILADISLPDEGAEGEECVCLVGYLKDNAGRPIYGAKVEALTGVINYSCYKTDHNGFFWGEGGIRLFEEATCLFYTEGAGCTVVNAGRASTHVAPSSRGRIEMDDVLIGDSTYENNYYVQVNITVNDGAGNPLPGIVVTCEGAKAEKTGFAGTATFYLRHNMVNYVDGTGVLDDRRITVMQNEVCYITLGNECNSCLPDTNIVPLPCWEGPLEMGVDFILADMNISILGAGYHPGGVYPFAIKLIDPAGRETFAQKLTMPEQTITLASIQSKGSYTFSDITYHLNGFTAPPEYTKMAILIGANRAFDDFVTWVADKVEFVDSSGTEASQSGAAKILLSIRSLYDNSNIAAYGTNVRYEWQAGDRLEIVTNGDGTIYPEVLQFIIEADYNNNDALDGNSERYNKLVINYSPALEGLTAGAQIKIIRKNACQPTELFYECCALIDLVDGVPQQTEGLVTGFDTYMVRRGIRWEDQTHGFANPFLHHSPSDYWGDHCISRGRVSAVNIYEKRLQFGRLMRLSNAFLENSNYNGLNDFSADRAKTFSGEQRGDIVFATGMEQLFMMVCENDNFIVNSANEFVRVASDGQVVALPPDSIMSDAQSKIVGNYGCDYKDTHTVVVGDGWVFWVDRRNNLPVIHDWNTARNAAVHPQDGPQVVSYFKNKLRGFTGEMTAGYDGVSKNVLLTFIVNNISVANNYGFVHGGNETIAFSTEDYRWPTMYSFTPQAYIAFPDNEEGDVFFSFADGIPYLHRAAAAKFNTFFGVSCDQVFEPVINEVSEKVKGFLAVQQQCDIPYFSDRVITSLGHESILPPAFVKKFTIGKYDCHFLMASNRNGGLFNGPQLKGKWMQVRFIRDQSVNNVIGSVDVLKQQAYSELDRMVARYQYTEQSAYNTNNR